MTLKPFAYAVAMALALTGHAAGQADGQPSGDFDFYVLSLSWSPSYCEAEGIERGLQCDGGRPFAFVLHGLWPQHERGWPQSCVGGPSGEPSRATVDAMLDVMPSPGLVRHQWRRHGTCSGLDIAPYFARAREAYERVAIPPSLRRLERHVMVSPDAVETAFTAANPGLPAEGVAVTCDEHRLREVRICMTKELEFRACEEVDRRSCRRERVVMPPVR